MKMRRKIGCWLAALCAVAILTAGLNSPAVLWAIGRWLDVGEPPRKADAVVLLNGAYNTRPFVAAALVRGHWAPTVILNTVALHAAQLAGAIPPSHEIALKVLEYGGVPPSDVVVLGTAAKTTFDEAAGVARYLDSHPIKRLLLVTEGPHTRRSEWIFRQVLSQQKVEIITVSAPTEDFDFAKWWQSEEGFLFVVSEYFKLIFYILRYSWLPYEIAVAAAALLFLRAWFCRRRQRDCV
jgi:uncharacterized SAM-binding protein YcdF (DUF218 family)